MDTEYSDCKMKLALVATPIFLLKDKNTYKSANASILYRSSSFLNCLIS